jgi:exosortase
MFRFGILLLFWFAAFLPIYPQMLKTWLNHSDNSHGMLVPLVSAYFLWTNRAELLETKISSVSWGAYVLFFSMLVYLASYAGSLAFVSRCMIVCSLMGLVLFCLGKEFFRQTAFPILFLLFMIPVPEAIVNLVSLPLQLFATEVSTSLIQTFAIPAYREGNMVYFVNTQLEVAEACSGIRSLVSLAMIAVIFAHLLKKGWGISSILLLSAVPFSILANILRVTGTGVLAHTFGSKVATGFLHDISGLAVFLFGMSMLFAEYRLFRSIL